jgi:hypothetical protein
MLRWTKLGTDLLFTRRSHFKTILYEHKQYFWFYAKLLEMFEYYIRLSGVCSQSDPYTTTNF